LEELVDRRTLKRILNGVWWYEPDSTGTG